MAFKCMCNDTRRHVPSWECFKVWNDTVCWTTTVNKTCINKKLSDSGGLGETAEIYSHSPFLPACSEHIFKLSYWYQSETKLELSESWFHQLIVCLLFLFHMSFSASMQTKQIAVSCDCDKSHNFFAFRSSRNLTVSNFSGTKRTRKISQKAETWICPESSPNWPFVWEPQQAHI